jgi:hypothetical protein
MALWSWWENIRAFEEHKTDLTDLVVALPIRIARVLRCPHTWPQAKEVGQQSFQIPNRVLLEPLKPLAWLVGPSRPPTYVSGHNFERF